MPKYETTAGYVTRADTYAQLLEHLIRVQELAAVMSHLHRTEGNHMDELIATGWLGVSELMKRMQHQVTQLAMGKLKL